MAKSDHLGEFEQLVLLAVMRLGEDAYGARIQEVLDETGGRESSISAIYITLTRLEDKGLVSSWKGGAEPVRGGKRRRYFRVDEEGLRALNETRSSLLAMWDGLESELERAGEVSVGD